MAQPAPKRMRLSTQDVLHELEKDEEPITAGSDDEFDDLICEEKERDEWGATDTGGMLDTHLSHGPYALVEIRFPPLARHSLSLQ